MRFWMPLNVNSEGMCTNVYICVCVCVRERERDLMSEHINLCELIIVRPFKE